MHLVTEGSVSDSWQGEEIVLVLVISRQPVGPTQSLSQHLLVVHSPGGGITYLGCENDLSNNR